MQTERIGRTILDLYRTSRTFARGLGADVARGYLQAGPIVLATMETDPIDPGTYFVRPDETGRFQNFVIESVLGSRDTDCGRCDIEIHAGNTAADSAGCLLVGYRTHDDLWRLDRSKQALDQLRAALGRDDDNPPTWVLHIHGNT